MNDSTSARKSCVMFVDANADLRFWVRTFLEREGHAVIPVRNSLEALALAADYPMAIDVLITDVALRLHQNGAELAECFRVLRPETQVVLLAGAEDRDRLAAGPLSDADFISRDFTGSQLAEAVARAVRYEWSEAA